MRGEDEADEDDAELMKEGANREPDLYSPKLNPFLWGSVKSHLKE